MVWEQAISEKINKCRIAGFDYGLDQYRLRQKHNNSIRPSSPIVAGPVG
jgi:hypothetical protein